MRWVFFALLAVNLGLLTVQMSATSPKDGAVPQGEGVERLALLRERDIEEGPEAVSEAPPVPTETEEESAVVIEIEAIKPLSVCYTLGPFMTEDLAGQARDQLLALTLKTSRRELEEREIYGYQVFIPSYPSRYAAVEAAKKIAAKGIREYYVMLESGFENAISLGLFREKRHAVNHMAALMQQGLRPEMRSRDRAVKIYWLDYQDTEDKLSVENIRAMFSGASVRRLPRDCN